MDNNIAFTTSDHGVIMFTHITRIGKFKSTNDTKTYDIVLSSGEVLVVRDQDLSRKELLEYFSICN